MPPFAAIERFFERLFERQTARLFRTKLQPIQLQRRVEPQPRAKHFTVDLLRNDHLVGEEEAGADTAAEADNGVTGITHWRHDREPGGRRDWTIVTFNDAGQNSEHYGVYDMMGTMAQLGLMEMPAPPSA